MPLNKNDFSFSSLRFTFFAFVFILLSGAAARASAINDCIDACFSGFSCATSESNGINTSDCQSGRDRCVKQCNDNISRDTEAPRATGAYGAIAYDKLSGAWGMADASQDANAAKESALGYCKRHGSGCEIVESFSKTCAAVAAGTDNRLGWAMSDNAKQAGLDAIKKCGENAKSGDGSRCFLQLYHCYAP